MRIVRAFSSFFFFVSVLACGVEQEMDAFLSFNGCCFRQAPLSEGDVVNFESWAERIVFSYVEILIAMLFTSILMICYILT